MMETGDCACGQTAVRDEAAGWFVRLQEPNVSVEEQQRFDAWLNGHPQHHEEFQLLQGLWMAADLLPTSRLEALVEPAPTRRERRPLLRYGVAASVLAVALGLGLFSGLNHSGGYRAEFATTLGERKHVALPDGSVIDLNSRSRLEVRYEQHQRVIELSAGEAMFSVAHDASRPFIVEAGSGKVTVTGTRFDVRRDANQTRVAVEQGTVKVQGSDAPHDKFVNLAAGLGTAVDAQGNVLPAYAVDPAQLSAWRNGKLVFNNASLSEVAAEVSRYRDKPLVVSQPDVASLRLTSVFKTDDTDALLKALPTILPVAVRTLADGSQEIISR
ncbi:FecR family protein [Pseudomonas sp. TSRC2-2]|uniref:FecR family protein n=1 Tax=unclassified Pseudomonas TaxID=196821 RepID=UPI003CE9B294